MHLRSSVKRAGVHLGSACSLAEPLPAVQQDCRQQEGRRRPGTDPARCPCGAGRAEIRGCVAANASSSCRERAASAGRLGTEAKLN